ncbi:hypothetical protein R6Q59_031433 [Mikania micrantha]
MRKGSVTINGQSGEIEANVQGCKITVSEEIIRSTFLFGDHSDHPISYPNDVVVSVLIRKGYEGEYPLLVKKLLHPYWRLLAHMVQMEISGNKGGTDVLGAELTSGIAALTMDWDFNWSRLVFEEMKKNLKGVKKEIFLMYPRFVQMILMLIIQT